MKGGEWSLAEQRTIETTLPPDIVLNRVRDYFESEEWEQPRGLPIRGPGGLKSDSVSASVIPPRGWGRWLAILETLSVEVRAGRTDVDKTRVTVNGTPGCPQETIDQVADWLMDNLL